jgi:hypothetical protein
VAQVLGDGPRPVDVAVARAAGAAGRSTAPRIVSVVRVSSFSISSLTTFRHHLAGGVLGLFRHDRTQRDQIGDEVDIGLQGGEEFRLQQHLLQAQALERVL